MPYCVDTGTGWENVCARGFWIWQPDLAGRSMGQMWPMCAICDRPTAFATEGRNQRLALRELACDFACGFASALPSTRPVTILSTEPPALAARFCDAS
jgi:hypothetical protein